eukprot:1142289-Pelagomonas_calceolata.AAC.2
MATEVLKSILGVRSPNSLMDCAAPYPCKPCILPKYLYLVCPSTSCAAWDDFAFVPTLSKLSELRGRTTFLLLVTVVMPKIMRSVMLASLSSGPLLPLCSASSQAHEAKTKGSCNDSWLFQAGTQGYTARTVRTGTLAQFTSTEPWASSKEHNPLGQASYLGLSLSVRCLGLSPSVTAKGQASQLGLSLSVRHLGPSPSLTETGQALRRKNKQLIQLADVAPCCTKLWRRCTRLHGTIEVLHGFV